MSFKATLIIISHGKFRILTILSCLNVGRKIMGAKLRMDAYKRGLLTDWHLNYN